MGLDGRCPVWDPPQCPKVHRMDPYAVGDPRGIVAASAATLGFVDFPG